MLQRYGQPLLDRAASSQRRVWFRLVTRDIDRHGTIIEPAGVDMTAFRANPVFLWMHDSGGGETTPPPDVVIGRVTNFDQSVEALNIEVEFDDDGDGLAATCFRKVKDGFLRMVSIGCNVLEEETVMVGTHKVPVYTRTELLECSLVIIGSNRGALKLDRSRVAAMLREVGGVGGVAKGAEAATAKAADVETAKATATKAAPAPALRDEKQVSTVAVIAPGHMLWGKRRDDGKWTTPGGHLHPGESPVDGAVRELAEESGIVVTADKLKSLGAVTNAKGVRIHTFRLDVPKMISPTTKRDPDKEIEVWDWVPFESGRLPQHILSNLHAQPNAIVAALRLDRAVMGAGGPAVDTLLTTTVYGGDAMDDFFGDDDDMLKVRDDDGYGEAASGASSASSAASASSASSSSLSLDSSSTSTPASPTRRFTTRGVVAHTNYPTVTTAWDAAAAVDRWKKWASSDGSGDKDKIDWAKFAKCFLWFDDKAPDSFGSYKYPHHDIVDGKPVTVWAGVVAAAARIDQSKGIPAGDIAKMKAHLAEHYKEFDKVAPWQRAAYDMPGGLQRVWRAAAPQLNGHVNAAPSVDGLVNLPTPQLAISAEAGTLLAESGDVYRLVGVVPHALVFKGPTWTKDSAALWAQKHGYAYYTAYPEDGFIELVILDAGAFRRDAFGVGVKFKTFRLQADPEVSVVVGVLKLKGERALAKLAKGQRGVKASRKAARQADRLLRSLVNLRLSPSASAEIAYGIKRSARLIVDKATVRQAERVQRSQSWTFRTLSAALSDDAVTRTLHGDSTGQREARRIVDEVVARLRQIKALRYSLG